MIPSLVAERATMQDNHPGALETISCSVTFFYHSFAGNDDREATRNFQAAVGKDPLEYSIEYSYAGGSNLEGGEHSYRASMLRFVDAAGQDQAVALVNNSWAAHRVDNIRFNSECRMVPSAATP